MLPGAAAVAICPEGRRDGRGLMRLLLQSIARSLPAAQLLCSLAKQGVVLSRTVPGVGHGAQEEIGSRHRALNPKCIGL